MAPANLRQMMGTVDHSGGENSLLSGVSTGVNTLPPFPPGKRRQISEVEMHLQAAGLEGNLKKADADTLALMKETYSRKKDDRQGMMWVPASQQNSSTKPRDNSRGRKLFY